MMINKTFLFLLILFSSCVCKKENVVKQKTSSYDCPEAGNCTIIIEKNKALEIKRYDNGSTGYTLIDDKSKNVILFNYTKNVDQTEVDGGYREEVVFEIDSKNKSITYTDKALQDTKMLFGRYCFCRGQTGLYKVMNGTLQIDSTAGLVNFNLEFAISEVPQIIKSITVKENQLY